MRPLSNVVANRSSWPGRLRCLWARLQHQANKEITSLSQGAELFGDQDRRFPQDCVRPFDVVGSSGIPPLGTYVTDGRSLFRIEQTFVSRSSGIRFLELENCRTTELIVWSLVELAASSLRCVTPMDASKLAEEIFESELGRPLDELIVGAPR